MQGAGWEARESEEGRGGEVSPRVSPTRLGAGGSPFCSLKMHIVPTSGSLSLASPLPPSLVAQSLARSILSPSLLPIIITIIFHFLGRPSPPRLPAITRGAPPGARSTTRGEMTDRSIISSHRHSSHSPHCRYRWRRFPFSQCQALTEEINSI